jgi:membrane-bound lytic murein transglycosylase D
MRAQLIAAFVFLVPTALVGQAEANDPWNAHTGARPLRQVRAPHIQASFAERRAVRGVALEETEISESPELRAMRRFEEQAFPRPGTLPPDAPQPDDTPLPLPPGLEGHWGGTGDIPRGLRSPENGPNPPQPPPQPGKEWLNQLILPDLPVRWEPQVIRYLEFFKNDTRGRAIMTSWLRKMGRYRDIIERRLDEQGLPKDLIYLAMVESGFDTGATSRKAAGGVWQFMPGAARAYGLEVSHWVDARRDPERAAEAAAHLLKDLYVRFGSWPLAFAAYNAGYGAILRSIARFNTNDFWELARHEAGLPWESTLYVPKILAAALVGHNLKTFGFDNVAPDPPWVFDRVEVSSGTSFGALARAVGTRPDVIEDLNPEYIAGRVPPDRPSVVMRVPLGTGASFGKAARQARATDKVQSLVLRFGETIEDVAKSHACSVRELKRLNGVSDTSELRGGMTILIPARAAATQPPASNDDDDDPILVAVPERIFSYPGRERVFYRTRDGDTLTDIAAAFGVSEDDLVEWNNIDPDAKLQPKLIFQIFVPEGFDRSSIVLLDPDKVRVVTLGSEEFLELQTARRGKTRLFYSARANDTLAKIAKRYGLSPGDLARVNRLSATSELAEGQRIVVYSPTPELPKEITARVTGASKKSAVASREVRRRGGKAASSKHDKATRSASAGQTPAARSRTRSTPAAKTSGKTSKGRTANGKH